MGLASSAILEHLGPRFDDLHETPVGRERGEGLKQGAPDLGALVASRSGEVVDRQNAVGQALDR